MCTAVVNLNYIEGVYGQQMAECSEIELTEGITSEASKEEVFIAK